MADKQSTASGTQPVRNNDDYPSDAALDKMTNTGTTWHQYKPPETASGTASTTVPVPPPKPG
ncbi:MAG: hypothetical protein ACOYO0_08115 [Sandarakinorhabdus sp.]